MLSKNKLTLFLSFLIFNVFSLQAEGDKKILIAYFTWAENTEVIDRQKAIKAANTHVFSMENNSGVDSVTTASVLPPGNTAKLASWIREKTGGDLYSIKVKDKYPCYWDECLDRASTEKSRRARPELTGVVENISDYDIVFLGFPTWWYTIPMAVATFVESNDLSGKTIVPFVSHGTSGIARTVRDLKKILPSTVSLKKEIGIYRSETDKSRSDVKNWLEEAGF